MGTAVNVAVKAFQKICVSICKCYLNSFLGTLQHHTGFSATVEPRGAYVSLLFTYFITVEKKMPEHWSKANSVLSHQATISTTAII